MSSPKTSYTRTLTSGRERDFPTYTDLAEHLANQGVVGAPDDLTGDDRDKLAGIFFEWMQYGQLGCQFAINLASGAEGPDEVCWLSQVADRPYNRELAEEIEKFLRDEGQEAEAVALIFQGATGPRDIVQITNVLCELPSWSWVEIECEDCRQRGGRAIGLRWSLPDCSLENWVLGFAPYELAPVTRRVVEAPFSVLAMRTLDHPSNSFFPVREDLAVHLANMPLHLPCPVHEYSNTFDKKTQRVSQQLLNSEMEDAARARVTLPVSETAFQELDETGRQGRIRKLEKWTKEKLGRGLRKCLNRL